MKRLIFAVIMAVLFFGLLNFIYCNLDVGTFGYTVVFKFSIPYIFSVKSVPLPMGFVLLAAFCLGMIMIALLEALPSLFKTFELRAKNKRIRQLERELTVVRQISEKRRDEPPTPEKDISNKPTEIQETPSKDSDPQKI